MAATAEVIGTGTTPPYETFSGLKENLDEFLVKNPNIEIAHMSSHFKLDGIDPVTGKSFGEEIIVILYK